MARWGLTLAAVYSVSGHIASTDKPIGWIAPSLGACVVPTLQMFPSREALPSRERRGTILSVFGGVVTWEQEGK